MMRSAATLAALLILPGLAPAQEVATGGRGTHEVAKRETLWALAGRYLGNPYRWPLIYEANQGLIKDPHWIYPGQVLVIPGLPAAAVTDVAVVSAAPVAAAQAVVAPAVAPAAQETPRPQALPASDLPPCPGPDGRTIFYSTGEGERGCRLEVPRPEERTAFFPKPEEVASGGPQEGEETRWPAVPRGLLYSAEWLEPWGGEVASLGTIRRLAEVDPGRGLRDRALLYERVHLTLSQSAQLGVGDVLQSFRVLRSKEGFGQVVRPSGILTVTGVEQGGATAWVTAQFDLVRMGDALRMAPDYRLQPGVHPVAVESNVVAKVLGFPIDQELHGLGALAFLDVGEAQGIAVGDEFAGLVNRGEGFAGAEVVRLQVILVRGTGSTARIITLSEPSLKAGSELKLVGKMR